MATKLLKMVVLAAVSDGEVQPNELEAINLIRKSHPVLRQVSDSECQAAIADIYNKISAGMEPKHILEQIGSEYSSEEKSLAYALAVEVCYSDFSIKNEEMHFLNDIEKQWKIPKEVSEPIKFSANLRFFI